MNTLILDSTNIDLNVGLCINGHLYFVSYPCWQQQSEKMIPEIEKLLLCKIIDRIISQNKVG